MVKADGFTGFSADVATRLRELPVVETAVPVRFSDGSVDGDVKTVGAMDPVTLGRVVDLGFASGSTDGLARDGVLVADDLARHLGVTTGDELVVTFSAGQVPLTVRGVYRRKNFIGIFGQSVPLIVAPTTLASGTGATPQDSIVLVRTANGATPAAQRSLERALGADFPNISVLTRDEFRDAQEAQINQFLTVLVAILALSEIIAILGIVNTLALSVFERTRELGLLRVVGMSRRQMRRMVRWESVVIAVFGGIVGIALGVLWGWAFTRALREQGLTVFRVPVVEVLLFLAGSMVAGVLAAVLPAWRASRLDVLEAIATE